MIVAATTQADVRKAVLTAREANLPFMVYATGHGSALPDHDDVVVVTTERMGGVLVDPDRHTAWVGPGARWGDVIAAAAPFGLAPLSGTTPSVGVIGYTLGGGLGWLSRRYGLAADSVIRAEVVTADGVARTVTAERDPDLFWALRGGGANFAAVTGLEFRLYPVATVHAGTATFAPDHAADVLTWYRDHPLPDALTANIVLTRDSLSIRGMYAGSAQDARRALAPLFRVAGTTVTDTWRTMPYTESGTVGGTAPHQFTYQAGLPDTLIAATLAAVYEAKAVEVRAWGGAIARVGGPAAHRDAPFSIVVDGSAQSAATIEAHATGGTFLNWLHDASRTHTAYTAANYARLRALKLAYDPDNVFGLGKNIPPAARTLTRLGA